MRFTYIAAANNTTGTKTLSDGSTMSTAGQPLGNVGQDVYIKKILIGQPMASTTITIFNKSVVVAADTDNIAMSLTGPATLTSSKEFEYERSIDFTFSGHSGLQVDGGNVMVDTASKVTVIWEFVDEAV